MTLFHVPAGPGESEITEKRSRFLGHLRPVSSEEEAKDFLREMRRTYHDARHNCWCYRIHGVTERFSDDGEPQGSAGMPMLEVFRREEVSNLVCVVTRYFGGVLLGTGGLSRAYSAAAKAALLDAGLSGSGEWREIRFRCEYALAERCRKLLDTAGAELTDTGYAGDVSFRAELPAETAEETVKQLRELSGGRIAAELSDVFVR